MVACHRYVLVAALALGATVAHAQPKTVSNADPKKAAATVNGEAITFGELEPLFRSWPLPELLTEGDRRDLQRDALQSLIEDVVMDQFLRKEVPQVNQSEVERRMRELELSQKQKGKTLADLLKTTGQSEAQLKRTITRQIQWIEYAEKKVNDETLQTFYTQNKPFFDKITVRASHIALRVAGNATPAEKEAVKKKLQDIRAQVVAGKVEFAEAAKKNSHCPTAPEGGDIGFFPMKFVIQEEVSRAAFALKVGDISEPFETDFGLHILKVTERKPGEPSTFKEVKEDVREFFIEDMHHTIIKQQLKAAKIEIHLP